MSTPDEIEVKRPIAKVIAAGGAAVDCLVSGECLRAATGHHILASGFPAEMVDDEPEETGYEIKL